ncbi:polysaccharide biosynthesis/export family protein [uncultured Thiodictyon sp.]|uniref:polysaccharide biosynthesis/export family protein n=1 Tax=uncultured Thiodictyon sp. TaxID=1846217 RepID=UPI0025D308AF|nr:polysaccharide biosynthesis/export family protein [uncultured Thiodictyon sp.]
MRLLSSLFLSVSLLLGACTGTIRPTERHPQGFLPWTDDAAVYRFMPGDELDVKLVYNPEFSDRVIVAPDGTIELTLIGSARALDRSVPELANELQERYARELRRPELSVIPRQFGSELVYVGGEVQRPGVFKLVHRMGVLEGIIEAGGFLDTARTDQVVLIRRTSDNRPMLKVVNVRDIIEGRVRTDDNDIPLHRFDVVFVPKSSVAEVDVWIDQYITRILPFSRSFNYSVNRASVQGGFPF